MKESIYGRNPIDIILHKRLKLSFSQTHKVGNFDIKANFVFPHKCNFLCKLHQQM